MQHDLPIEQFSFVSAAKNVNLPWIVLSCMVIRQRHGLRYPIKEIGRGDYSALTAIESRTNKMVSGQKTNFTTSVQDIKPKFIYLLLL